jgi:hypothetical protein
MNLRLISSILCLVLCSSAAAQLPASAFSFNCTKDTVMECGQSCITLRTTIPSIKAFSDQYIVSKASCFKPPVNPATPGISTNLNQDNRYTPTIPLPFLFSFYGIYYLQCTINTNGLISFDLTNSSANAQWEIQGLDGSLPSEDYDRAIIMGAFHDIDIGASESPNRQIKYDVVGRAPHRKWVVTFYKVSCFDCENLYNNTYQISLYEGLGLVEIHLFERNVCMTWNAGGAMIGMQNYDRNNGIMATGRSAFTTPRWSGTNINETWRFAPNAGPSLLKKVELYKSTGELVTTGDTVNSNDGTYQVLFNNICPDSAFVKYIVKSSYYNVEYPFQFPVRDSLIYETDTINIIKPTADQFVWTGAVSTSWEDAANWSCNTLPGETSNVIINSGTVIINSYVTINKITIRPSAVLTVNTGYNLTILHPGD